MFKYSIQTTIITLFVLLTQPAHANALHGQHWQLDTTHSHVSFSTVKKENITEKSHFKQIRGQIKDGEAQVFLDSQSVETLIPIRNERIQKFVLQTDKYPEIQIQADLKPINNAADIQLTEWSLPAKLSIAGATKDIQLKVQIQMLNDGKLAVNSIAPVVVAAKEFALADGVQKLSEIMGGIHISNTVPVYFSLVFQPNS